MPVHVSVIELSHLFDTGHELGKLLELRPLVYAKASDLSPEVV